jgi:hypothetical protein
VSDLDSQDVERPGIDRRSLIKRAAATGAIAWTAPLILDSLASPAAALTCGACFRVTFPPDDTGPNFCDAPSVAVSGTCPAGTVAGCSTPTNLAPGTSYSAACITPPSFCGVTTNFTGPFVLNTSTACIAGCNTPRQFLAAGALTSTGNCVAPNPSFSTSTSITWFRPEGQNWASFTFVIGCVCSG